MEKPKRRRISESSDESGDECSEETPCMMVKVGWGGVLRRIEGRK